MGVAGENEPTYAQAAAVAGLAREVEGLRRTVERLTALPGRVEDLAELVARLTETVAVAGGRPAAPRPGWTCRPTAPTRRCCSPN
jgi:hypothetical protein